MSYQEDALRTKSDLFILTPALEKDLQKIAGFAMLGGRIGNNIKRSIFYGKDYVDPDVVMDNAKDIEDACKLDPKQTGLDPDVVHGILGIFTEATELMELLLQAIVTGEKIDRDKLVLELGDVRWYGAIASNAVHASEGEVEYRNIAKLRARFPDKFTANDAINRDEGKENTAAAAAI